MPYGIDGWATDPWAADEDTTCDVCCGGNKFCAACSGTVHNQYKITISGMANVAGGTGNCSDCPSLNGDYVVTLVGDASTLCNVFSGLYWKGTSFDDGACSFGGNLQHRIMYLVIDQNAMGDTVCNLTVILTDANIAFDCIHTPPETGAWWALNIPFNQATWDCDSSVLSGIPIQAYYPQDCDFTTVPSTAAVTPL